MNKLLERNEGSIQKTAPFTFPDEKVSVTSHTVKKLHNFVLLMQYYVQKKHQKSFDGT